MSKAPVAWKTTQVRGRTWGSPWRVPETWELVRALGSGSYGAVAAFQDNGHGFAVKKVHGVFDNPIVALRTMREIRILAHFNHPNILGIESVQCEGGRFSDIYICLELCDADLNHLIHGTKQKLTDFQMQCITYQILRGLLCLHTAHVIHRDLKPGNVLVTSNGVVKIGDLGLSRCVGSDGDDRDEEVLTEYVVTRWYRAPEVVLTACRYTNSVDVWSLGCILAEMLTKRRLFEGKDSLDQIRTILVVLGTPPPSDLNWISADSVARKFIDQCDRSSNGEAFRQILKWPGANPVSMNLVARMLCFDPAKRISVEQALNHRYLQAERQRQQELISQENSPASSGGSSPSVRSQGGPGSRAPQQPTQSVRDADLAAIRTICPMDWSFDTELCYDEKGRLRPFDPDVFRAALADTCEKINCATRYLNGGVGRRDPGSPARRQGTPSSGGGNGSRVGSYSTGQHAAPPFPGGGGAKGTGGYVDDANPIAIMTVIPETLE